MKKCPTCSQFFGEENDFCLEDGTRLAPDPASSAPTVYASSGEMPTQYLPRTQAEPPARGSSSNTLYLLIGVLATALVALGAYVFVSRDDGKQKDASNNAQVNGSPSPSPKATAPAANIMNAATPPAAPPPVAPVALSGKWNGEIVYPSGTAYSAQADFTDAGNGAVRGQIVWTLLRTPTPAKKYKIGSSGTEFVQGSFDPARRTLSLAGYDEMDPADMIILDKYRLTVSADGQGMSGPSLGGKVPGKLSLRRF